MNNKGVMFLNGLHSVKVYQVKDDGSRLLLKIHNTEYIPTTLPLEIPNSNTQKGDDKPQEQSEQMEPFDLQIELTAITQAKVIQKSKEKHTVNQANLNRLYPINITGKSQFYFC
jgi:hypothetical protein